MKNFVLYVLCAVLLLAAVVALVGCADEKTPEQPTSYVVTYVGVKTTTATVAKGDKAPVPPEQKKSGYSFVGWYNGDVLYDFDLPVNSDLTLTAKFEKQNFSVKSGVVYESNGGYLSGAENSLMAFTDRTFEKGTLSGTVTPSTRNDCGVIFGVAESTSDFWWEENRYFCVLINFEGIVLFAEVGGSPTWREVSSSTELQVGYSANKTYRFEIAYSQEGICVVKVYDEALPSVKATIEAEIGALAGNGFGYRSQGASVKFGAPSVDETAMPASHAFDDVGGFYARSGALRMISNRVYSWAENTIGLWHGGAMINGTVQATVAKSGSPTDDGIIFGLTDNDKLSFWENGVSYYFYFISRDNTAYLGKVVDGTWEALAIQPVSVKPSNEYVLKAEVTGSEIACYVDGTLMFAYNDAEFLVGDKVGIRAEAMTTAFTDFSVQSIEIEETLPEGYTIANGNFREVLGRIQATENQSVMVKDGAALASGTLTAKVSATGDSGVVFGLDAKGKDSFWESGVSYYFFFINRGGAPTLAKIDDGVYTEIKHSSLAAMFSSGKEYELKVVLDGGKAYCYVDGVMHATAQIQPSGDKVALRGDKGAQFKQVSLDDSTQLITTSTLIFGHSYTQLWTTYKQDFAEIPDVLDIGIGGTQVPDWKNLTAEVATYNFEKAIFMIGINDMYGEADADVIFQGIKQTVDEILQALPDTVIALVNVNKVPWGVKQPYYDVIDSVNAKLAEYAQANAQRVKLVDFASAVLNSDGSFKDYFVPDQLHLNANGYAVLTQLCKQALGING